LKKTTKPRPKIPHTQLVFGKYFSDHWLHVQWSKSQGWGTPIISPYGKFEIEPGALVFHYALECFDGLKAYKDAQGRVRLFRPDENMKRMDTSVRRLCMPTFNGDKFLEYIKKLILLDKDWIPDKKGYSLYIRPTMIATESVLGVHPAEEVLLYVITCPVGPYYPTGFKPVALYADSKAVRAWPGGTGGYKLGANYAPGIAPALEAASKGYQQILWLHEDKITEVGTMNLFCLWINKEGKKELITAPLDGQILPGVTRKSILELTREWNQFLVSEKEFDMKSLIQALKEGRVIEMFGAGTAAVVSPVYKIFYQGKDHSVPCKDNTAGELTAKLMESLLAIQYGETNSPWSVIVG